MKILSTGYTFNAAGKTVTFSGTIPSALEAILSITNVTRGVLLFQPQAGAAFSGTWGSPTLTLACDTTGMANGDRLLIIIEDGSSPATAANQDTGNASLVSIDGKLPELNSGRLPVDIGGATVSVGTVEIANDAGNPISVSASSLPLPSGAATAAKQPAIGTAGTPSADVLSVQGASGMTALKVDGSAVTQPISAAALPLPTGAATEATLSALNTKIPASPAQEGGNLATILGRLPSGLTVTSTRLLVDGSGVTQPVSAASLPLPTGAATSTNQATANTSLSSIDGKLPALVSSRVPVDGSGVTQPSSTFAYRSAVSITRPANQTPYSAGDVIGDTGGSAIITLASVGPSGGAILIQSVRLLIYTASLPSGMGTIRAHFYTASPTAIADNATWDLVSGDRASYLDFIDLPTPTDMGSTLFTRADWPGKMFKLANASTSLFCVLQTIAGFTAGENSTVWDLRVNALEAGR